MGVEGEVAYPYFFHEIRNPGWKGWNVGLKGWDIGIASVAVESDAYGG